MVFLFVLESPPFYGFLFIFSRQLPIKREFCYNKYMNNNKGFHRVVAVVASIITVLHLLRLVYGWEAVIGGWMVPLWLSVVAVVLFGWLAWKAFGMLKQ